MAPVYVEVAVFCDVDLSRHMATLFPGQGGEQLVQVVLAMINAVSFLGGKMP